MIFISNTKKKKLFLDLNELKRINTSKIRYLTFKELQGIKKKYSSFLTILDFNTFSEEKKIIFKNFETNKKISKHNSIHDF